MCRRRAAGRAWLDAAGTDREAAGTEIYLAELAEDVAPIGGLAFIAGWVCLALAALTKSGR